MKSQFSDSYRQKFLMEDECTFLVRTNKEKDFFNFAKVSRLTTTKKNIPAEFGPLEEELDASKEVMRNYNNLARNLIIARGAKVMINQNINTSLKICNGSLGTK